MEKTENIFERIQDIINEDNTNIASFAKKIGVGDQTIRSIVKYKRNYPGYEVLLKIIQTYEWLNIEWFITGKGDMRKSYSLDSNNPLLLSLKEENTKLQKENKELIKANGVLEGKLEILINLKPNAI